MCLIGGTKSYNNSRQSQKTIAAKKLEVNELVKTSYGERELTSG